ncbi:Putative oxidoreductase [hydrothermal vent metagenome]|uniref:Oxidoreductase n=1 Tax=hydrothermal vent metagenome TaxID=652676 RepID=A0A3B1CAV1_9ZZZZ
MQKRDKLKNKWLKAEADKAVKTGWRKWGGDLALRAYTSRLIGGQRQLVLHGGGNTSVKGFFTDITGEIRPALFVKASGHDLAQIEPGGHCALDLEHLMRLKGLKKLSDDNMLKELRRGLVNPLGPTPSIESLVHAFIPKKFIDHTHADSILALTNRRDGEKTVREALGKDVLIVDYKKPGFDLAKAVSRAFEKSAPGAKENRGAGMVLINHGLITWGDTAEESYSATIRLVSKAEKYLKGHRRGAARKASGRVIEKAEKNYLWIAPLLRGLLLVPDEASKRYDRRFILKPLITPESLVFAGAKKNKKIALAPPLTSDHIIRVKPKPLWIDKPDLKERDKLKSQLEKAIGAYAESYKRYFDKHSKKAGAGIVPFDPLPRVIFIPGVGAVCAGRNVDEAIIARDITEQTIRVKTVISSSGEYRGISERSMFEMEYFNMQSAKLTADDKPLTRKVALVTGACGAIGSAICAELLKNGCHVAATDLPGKNLTALLNDLKPAYGDRISALALDVTDTKNVAEGFNLTVREWGGIDLVVVNAGLAHVSSLAKMDPASFLKLENVNVHGTLNTLAQSARLFETQGAGGDIVLISTKNVFAPGARFGAYSATKAAAHQLARIASLELANLGVRVNMVAPDAVFSHGKRKSGLWAEVGPDRMKARGLSEKGLEKYYRNRNLLKEKITGEDVARAVLFFATRKTPTTGATIPVDGGLPDATPR